MLKGVPKRKIEALFDRIAGPSYTLHVDLAEQRLYDQEGLVDWPFEVDGFRKHCLLNGLDDIGLTLEHEDAITAYEIATGMDLSPSQSVRRG